MLDKINPKHALIAVLLGAGGFNSLMAAGNTLTWFNITWFLSRAIYVSPCPPCPLLISSGCNIPSFLRGSRWRCPSLSSKLAFKHTNRRCAGTRLSRAISLSSTLAKPVAWHTSLPKMDACRAVPWLGSCRAVLVKADLTPTIIELALLDWFASTLYHLN